MSKNHDIEQADAAPKAAARKIRFSAVTERMKVPKTGQCVVWDTSQTGLSMLLSAGGTRTYRATFGLRGRYFTSKLGRV
jgi:hypothetical protein